MYLIREIRAPIGQELNFFRLLSLKTHADAVHLTEGIKLSTHIYFRYLDDNEFL